MGHWSLEGSEVHQIGIPWQRYDSGYYYVELKDPRPPAFPHKASYYIPRPCYSEGERDLVEWGSCGYRSPIRKRALEEEAGGLMPMEGYLFIEMRFN